MNWSEVIDWLPPHHTVFSVVASRTVNLSFGERPVCVPVSAVSAPSEVIVASPAAKRKLIKRGRAEIPLDLFEFFETEFVGAEGTVVHARIFHEVFLLEPAIRLRVHRKAPVAGAS